MVDRRISGGANRQPQERAVSAAQWTRKKREAFLDHLAMSCNVTASVRSVGMTTGGLYQLRRRDPEFAALWRSALLTGYDRLEERLLQHAGAAINDVAIGETEVEEPVFDPRIAMDLLRQHRATVEGREKKPMGGKVFRATRAEAEAALLRKLDALEKRLGTGTGGDEDMR